MNVRTGSIVTILIILGITTLVFWGNLFSNDERDSISNWQSSIPKEEPSPNNGTGYVNNWQISTPEEQGMNSTLLNAMLEDIEAQNYAIDSVLIIKNGYLVLEEYPNPEYNQNKTHVLYSVTKSVISALVGIAIQEGFIENVDQKVVDFFPHEFIYDLNRQKQRMTIRHLLTMSAGIGTRIMIDNVVHSEEFTDLYGQTFASWILCHEMICEPGMKFQYQNGAAHLLSAILENATGYSTLDFAKEFLFGPLGITEISWDQDPQGVYYGGVGLSLRPYDMAKFGYLYLNDGVWNGEQLLSPEWIAKSTKSYFTFEESGYGYLWWTIPGSSTFIAYGSRGQAIFVLPGYDLVVVVTANTGVWGLETSLLEEYIVPAIFDA